MALLAECDNEQTNCTNLSSICTSSYGRWKQHHHADEASTASAWGVFRGQFRDHSLAIQPCQQHSHLQPEYARNMYEYISYDWLAVAAKPDKFCLG